jgi:hypothetical protein
MTMLHCISPLTSLATLVLLIATTRGAIACGSAAGTCSKPDAHARRMGAWWVVDTENFRVCSLQSAAEAERTAAHCEKLRREQVARWAPDGQFRIWNPRCHVVLHPNEQSYTLATGAGVGASLGSSLIQPGAGPVTARRIDLRADIENFLVEALPHELCHVVIADQFRDRAAPLWFDEGAALLYDTPQKRRLHQRDFHQGLATRSHFRTAELFAMESYPPGRVGVFYGQCAYLTRHLLTRGTPETMTRFVARMKSVGANQALRECYGISSAELDRISSQHIALEHAAPELRTDVVDQAHFVTATGDLPVGRSPECGVD